MEIYCSTYCDFDLPEKLKSIGISFDDIKINPMVDCYVVYNVINIPDKEKLPLWFTKWCNFSKT